MLHNSARKTGNERKNQKSASGDLFAFYFCNLCPNFSSKAAFPRGRYENGPFEKIALLWKLAIFSKNSQIFARFAKHLDFAVFYNPLNSPHHSCDFSIVDHISAKV